MLIIIATLATTEVSAGAVAKADQHDMDLVDVTLACDDNEQIQAHRIILSAGSYFLRDLLKNATDLQPFVFFSGVGKTELRSIVDFLYCGEIKVKVPTYFISI